MDLLDDRRVTDRGIRGGDMKLARHRAPLEAGADSALIASWSREVQAQRTAAEATLAGVDLRRGPARRLSRDEIRIVVDALGGLPALLGEAAVVGLTFLFGFGNVWTLALRLGVPAWVAPLVAPSRGPVRHGPAPRHPLPRPARGRP